MTVTTVLLIDISSARASSAVPWKASKLSRESGGTSIWETPKPTTSAISAAALGSTQSAPPMYSFRACRRTDRRMLRTERWLDVELMVRVRLSHQPGVMGDFGGFAYAATAQITSVRGDVRVRAIWPKFAWRS